MDQDQDQGANLVGAIGHAHGMFAAADAWLPQLHGIHHQRISKE